MNRWLLLLVALLPNCTGCLAYAYPQVVYVPELTVPNPEGNVHAFRVDIDQTLREPKPAITEYTLASIKVDARGQRSQIPSQLEVAPATGVLNPLKVTDAANHERNLYTMHVRLYRAGFQTQEVRAGDKAPHLSWSKAEDLLAQEKAVDDLLAVPSTPGNFAKGTWWDLASKGPQSPPPLQPGSASFEHSSALKFAASEYQRLANSPMAGAPNMHEARDRMRSKAVWLNKYAEQPVWHGQ